MNPWIGVTLIGLGVAADVVLTLTHNAVSSLVPSVVVAGIGVVQSFARAPTADGDGRGVERTLIPKE
jgi:hypothetical protein